MASERIARVVRIPRGIYERVAEQAAREGRSINAEIVRALRQVIETQQPQR